MTDKSTLAHISEPEEFPHDDILDSRDLHGRTFGPEIDEQISDASECTEDWSFGATLIADSYFITYAQEFADDIGAINSEAAWPLYHIDWNAAARDLQQDYTSVTIDGRDYWIR